LHFDPFLYLFDDYIWYLRTVNNILDHFEYIILGSIERLGPVVCLAFEMLAFLSYWVVHRKKRTVAKVHNLSTFFQKYIVKVFITVYACIISLV